MAKSIRDRINRTNRNTEKMRNVGKKLAKALRSATDSTQRLGRAFAEHLRSQRSG